MKYWWFDLYLSFFQECSKKNLLSRSEKKMLQNFLMDYSYRFVVPFHYMEYYQKIRTIAPHRLSDCGLQLLLSYSIYHGIIEQGYLEKCIFDGTFDEILNLMKKIPDTSLPATDYTEKDMLEEIKNLNHVSKTTDKIKSNNVAACYYCRNIFYTDTIYQKNKKKECLCPYCNHSSLYFDNDFIPMDFNFLQYAYLYHQDDIPFVNIVSYLKEKVLIAENGTYDYYFLNRETFVSKIQKGRSHYFVRMPFTKSRKVLTSKEEEYLSFSLLHILKDAENRKKVKPVILFNFSQDFNQSEVFAITTMLSFLSYFLHNYFTSIERITILTPNPKIKDIYVKCLENFCKVS